MAAQDTTTRAGRTIGVVVRMTTRAKGFGFIRDAEGNEYFLHRTACIPNALFDDLKEGDPVSYKVSDTPKGQKASDLERIALPQSAITAILAKEEKRGNR